MIDKYIYKYKWLENAETKENYDQSILKFFNKNKCSQYIDIRLILKGDKISGYLKKKNKETRNNNTKYRSSIFQKKKKLEEAFQIIIL